MRGGEVGDAAGASLSSLPQTHTISLLILTLQAELSDTAGSCLMRKEKEKKKPSRNHASDEWTGDNQQRGDGGVTARLGVMPVHHLSAALKQSASAEGRPV